MKTTSKTNTTETAKPPVDRLRMGLLNATIWQRTTEKGAYYTVSFERRYRDQDGQWKSTHSYDTADLLALAKLADQAHSRILEIEAAATAEKAA